MERVVREKERAEITGVGRTPWYMMEQQGAAPKRVKLGPRMVGWRESDLQRWIDERFAQIDHHVEAAGADRTGGGS